MSLFEGYDFKKFARAVRKVSSHRGRFIRMLYSGYLYPELEFYVKIEKEYRSILNG